MLWDVKGELRERDHLAEITWTTDRSEAVLLLPPPATLKADDESVEETLIHELLHLRLDGHRPLDRADRSLPRETAINAMAKEYRRRKYRGALPVEKF